MTLHPGTVTIIAMGIVCMADAVIVWCAVRDGE